MRKRGLWNEPRVGGGAMRVKALVRAAGVDVGAGRRISLGWWMWRVEAGRKRKMGKAKGSGAR